MNQSQKEIEFFAAYDACKAKDMGEPWGRLSAGARKENAGLNPASPAIFIPAREYLPRVDLHV